MLKHFECTELQGILDLPILSVPFLHASSLSRVISTRAHFTPPDFTPLSFRHFNIISTTNQSRNERNKQAREEVVAAFSAPSFSE
jgi:hypothetical protein